MIQLESDGMAARRFAEDGFCVIRLSAPAQSYTRLREQLAGYDEEIGHGLADLPEMAPLLSDPVLIDTLRDILGGAEPVRDPCCHLHLGGLEPQAWHQDRYCDQPEWPRPMLIACLYPQDTTHEMGPTVVCSRGGVELSVAGPAGTCLIMRHNLWHRRAAANPAAQRRVMLKCLFAAQGPCPEGESDD